MGNTVRMVSQDRSRRKRRVWILAGAVAALIALVLILTLGRSAIANYAQEEIVAQARTRGFVLHLTTADVSSSAIHLDKATLELEGVSGVSGAFESAEIGLEHLAPTRILVEGLVVQAIGEPLTLMRAISDWQTKYAKPNDPNALPTPELRRTRFNWRPVAQVAPFVTIEDLVYAQGAAVPGNAAKVWAITGSRAQVGAYALQPLALALQLEPDAIEIGFGAAQMNSAVVRGGWRHVASADDFHVTFGTLPLAPLLDRLGLPKTDPKFTDASCGGGISLRVPEDAKLPYSGQLSLELVGWTPPHPAELDGLDFGANTKIESMLALDRALSHVTLSGLKVTAGALRLVGQGIIDVIALSRAQMKAELKGQLPCSALASSMAESKLGKAYGRWVAQNAHRAIEGHVDVTLQIDADSSRLDQAKIVKQVGVGCGVRPLTFKEVLSLGLPPPPDADLLRHVAQNLPKFDITLPPIPKLPPLPTVKSATPEKKER
jgi:hypothetical protein